MVFERGISEAIELARRYVRFELTIPLCGVKRFIPRAEARPLFR